MTSIKPRLLKGFRDYLPDQMILRSRAMQTIRGVFESFGFVPLDTPTLEYAEILLGKYGDDAEKLLYKFADNGGREVCMRYDLTVPLARVVAQYPDLQKPFKRYQMAPCGAARTRARGATASSCSAMSTSWARRACWRTSSASGWGTT